MLIDPTYLTIQTMGILLVGTLLRMLSNASSARFMAYWSYGWFALALALATLGLSLAVPQLLPALEIDALRAPALTVFCLLEYACGFYLWAGCRHYATGVLLGRSDLWRLIGPMSIAVVAPLVVPTVRDLFPIHAGLCSFLFLMSFVAILRLEPKGRLSAIGLRIAQVSILGLIALFLWYALSSAPNRDLYALHFSPLYDGLVVTLLGFGLVILATDFTQRELHERNHRLAEITDQLAVVARTDSLTGLLNRRAFDAMVAERGSRPFSGSVAVIDMNDLKRLNDRFGHRTGDAAIQTVARSLRSHFRITDPIFRMGGDEFLVVLEDGAPTELTDRLESVDRSLLEVRLPCVEEPRDLHLAWGIHEFEGVDSLTAAMERADEAMYRDKAYRKQPAMVS